MNKNIRKQLIDQPLHLVMGALLPTISFFLLPLLAVQARFFEILLDWFFTVNTPVLLLTGAVMGVLPWIYREVKQWPPRESAPWDPYLDVSMYVIGGCVSTYVFYAVC